MADPKNFLTIETDFTMEDIDIIYRTCGLHSDLESDFGMFCLGANMVLRSIFKEFQIAGRYTFVDLQMQPTVASTLSLLEGFDAAKRDLRYAEGDKVTNKPLSEQVKMAAKELEKMVDEERRKNEID